MRNNTPHTGKHDVTAQIAEQLLYEGKSVAMCSTPLSNYFAMTGVRPRFEDNCTALWRGYVGHWEIIDNRLYLVELHGTLEDGTDVSVATVFPDFPDRVFAHWYSGTIRIPQGKMLKYLHAGFGSTYERDLILELERGVVVATHIRHNGKSDAENAPEDYSTGGMVIFSRFKRKDRESA